MLTVKQIKEIKEHLEKAQAPLFFFDNDPDGLCSFLLLQKYTGKGKGIPIKSFPELTANYFRKVEELNADYIFILDKPVVSKEFFERVEQVNIPVVWIDHHAIEKKDVPDFVNYYNPLFNKNKTNEPVTALCYQITNQKQDLWLAVAGCISDSFVPKFYPDFKKIYPEFSINSKDALKIYHDSQIGKIAQIFSFALKDRITNVINMLKFLMKTKTPYEVLEENSKNYSMHQRFDYINRKFRELLAKAKQSQKTSKLLFFKYSGKLSISSDLANELIYLFPEKIIVVVYVTDVKANISVRGKNIRQAILKSVEDLEDATAGGHKDAVGAKIKIKDLSKFKENLENFIE